MHASCILSLLEMTHPIVFRIYTLRNVMNKMRIYRCIYFLVIFLIRLKVEPSVKPPAFRIPFVHPNIAIFGLLQY